MKIDVRTDGRTDMSKVIFPSRNFSKAPKKFKKDEMNYKTTKRILGPSAFVSIFVRI